jgi:hypothetical protein
MSQINDALKRAKATQHNNPPPLDGPQLHSAGTEQAVTRGIGLAAPFGFVLVALLGVFLLWQIRQRLVAEARQSGPIENSVADTTSAASTPAVTAPVNPQASTNALENQVSAAASFKLQAILFDWRNSSAMIDGQTVRMGDHVSGYRVATIGERTVTLVSAAETNVLTLNR